MAKFDGKVIIITGASSGIGTACARRLSREGASLVLGARRSEKLEDLAGELRGSIAWRPTDVRNYGEVVALAQLARERFGRIDAIINNAGIMPLAAMAQADVADWDRAIDVNIKGVLYGIKAVLDTMLAQGSGHVINISSLAGYMVSPTTAVYSATKFAVRAISEGLRKEVGDKIRVTTIYPGAVATALAESVPDPNIRQYFQNMLKTQALPADAIADAVVYALAQPPGVSIDDLTVTPAGSQVAR